MTKAVVIDMKLVAGGKQEFTYPRSRYIQWCSIDTFQRAKAELINKGFIEELENNKNLRKANVYRLLPNYRAWTPP